jgi:hypothetical protein
MRGWLVGVAVAMMAGCQKDGVETSPRQTTRPTLSTERTAEYDAACARLQFCKGMGVCNFDVAEYGGESYFDKGRCIAGDGAKCRASDNCKIRGDCGIVGKACKAVSDADCKAAVNCRRSGDCALMDVTCRPASDADCRGSYECGQLGACARVDAGGGPTCKPGKESDCTESRACKSLGDCHLLDGRCAR